MKLRIRLLKTTVVVSTEDSVTLADLKNIAETNVPQISGKTYVLSLNGSPEDGGLEGDGQPLTDFGIVSGDLIHILLPDDENYRLRDELQNHTNEPGVSGSNHGNAKSGDKAGAPKSKVQKTCSQEKSVLSDTNVSDTEKMDTSSQESPESFNTANATRVSAAEVRPTDSEVLERTMEMDKPRSQDEIVEIKRYLNEPVLCREATSFCVPDRLRQIYQSAAVMNKSEAMCAVLHVLMLETGFNSNQERHPQTNGCTSMPSDWRYTGSYNISYVHLLCRESSCTLVIVPMGSQIMVHGNISGGEAQPPCQLQLKVDNFVKALHNDVLEVYQNLPKLSRMFKDKMALPLLQNIHRAAGICEHQGLLGLSSEIKLLILKFLGTGSLLRLSEVCRSLNVCCKDPWLWRRNYLLHWTKRDHNDLNQNWYEIYKQEYEWRKDLRERLRRMTPVIPHHPFFPRPNPIAGFAPVPPGYGGIIGGDYDLNPNFGFPDPLFPRSGRRIFPERSPFIPQPRYDPMGPDPDMNIPFSPGHGRGMQMGGRPGRSLGGFGPRFL